ncbi:hypothetical protein [Nonomuraea salmonea]|uniref:Lectin-like protein BA14k n=1 Tax=Nonomuraea salmonea TaxID=46181 RepID=A0ABV5P2T5_9ACTN
MFDDPPARTLYSSPRPPRRLPRLARTALLCGVVAVAAGAGTWLLLPGRSAPHGRAERPATTATAPAPPSPAATPVPAPAVTVTVTATPKPHARRTAGKTAGKTVKRPTTRAARPTAAARPTRQARPRRGSSAAARRCDELFPPTKQQYVARNWACRRLFR